MMYPCMARNPRLTATVAALSGGLDTHTADTLIADNALAECRDMWWRGGALRTRPGLTANAEHAWTGAAAASRFFTDSEGWRLVLAVCDSEYGRELDILTFAPDGTAADNNGYHTDGNSDLDGFLVPAGGSLSGYTVLLYLTTGRILGGRPSAGLWTDLTESAYRPLVMVNGKPVTSLVETAVTGTLYEGLNRLTPRFRSEFTSDGEGLYYVLPRQELTGEMSVTRGGETLTVPDGSNDSPAGADGRHIHLYRDGGVFCFMNSSGEVQALPDTGVRNNVKAEAGVSSTDDGLLATMHFGTWFGGDRSSYAGGTRLFLGGSSDRPALILWSDIDNPLYFPETAYAVVGTPEQRLTAFGKQGNLLILFKEHELYAAEYVRGTVTTADLESGTVTDVSAAEAVFPLTPLHAEIGCDLPGTIALPDNRLTWACSDGTVYALSSSGSLNQRCVTRLSAPVEAILRAAPCPAVTAAQAADGMYILLWGRTLLLWEEDESRWHRLVWPENGTVPCGLSRSATGQVLFPAVQAVGSAGALFWFALTGERDTVISHTGTDWSNAGFTLTEQPVTGMLRTKSYDFGTPDAGKQVVEIFADLTANGRVYAGYVTERGEQSDTPVGVLPGTGCRLTPHLTRCRRLSLRLTGEGLCLNSLTLRMKTGLKQEG